MPHFEVRIVADPDELDALPVLPLYEAVGWTSYTRDPATLAAALRGSSFVAVAVALDGGRLVGLVRAISDDATISYVQDVLVHPDAQRRGSAGP